MKRIAVLLCGHYRTFPDCKASLLEAFKDYQVDYFVNVYNKRYGYHEWVKDSIGFKEDEIIDLEYVCNGMKDMNIVSLIMKEDAVIPSDIDISKYPILQDIFSQIYNIDQNLKVCELNGSDKYDFIVKTRFDINIFDKVKLPDVADDNVILSPYIMNCSQPSDAVYIANIKTIRKLVNLLMRQYDKKIINPHNWLQKCLEDGNLTFKYLPECKAEIRRLTKFNTTQ